MGGMKQVYRQKRRRCVLFRQIKWAGYSLDRSIGV